MMATKNKRGRPRAHNNNCGHAACKYCKDGKKTGQCTRSKEDCTTCAEEQEQEQQQQHHQQQQEQEEEEEQQQHHSGSPLAKRTRSRTAPPRQQDTHHDDQQQQEKELEDVVATGLDDAFQKGMMMLEGAATNLSCVRRSSRGVDAIEEVERKLANAARLVGKQQTRRAYEVAAEAAAMAIRVKDAEMKAREESLKAEYKALLREAVEEHKATAIKLVKDKKEDFDKLLEIEKQRLQKEKDMEVEQVRRRYAPREEKRNEMDECLGRRMMEVKAQTRKLTQECNLLRTRMQELEPALETMEADVVEMRAMLVKSQEEKEAVADDLQGRLEQVRRQQLQRLTDMAKMKGMERNLASMKRTVIRTVNAKADAAYHKDMEWRKEEGEEEEGGEERKEFNLKSDSSYYRYAQKLLATMMDVCDYDLRHFAEVMPIILNNPKFGEAIRSCGLATLDGKKVKEEVMKEKLLGQLTEIFSFLKDKHHDDRFRIALQVLATSIARPDEPRYGAYMKWLCETLGVGDKSLDSGYQRATVLAESEGEDGEFFQEKRAFFKSKKYLYPELVAFLVSMWLSNPISKQSPNMKDWAHDHLPAEADHGSKTHGYDDVEGERRRLCVKGLKEWNGDGAVMETMVEELLGWVGEHCVKARIYHQQMSNQQAFDYVKGSVEWESHLAIYPHHKELLTFSFFRSLKPHLVKPATRNTSQCVHHLEAKNIVEDFRFGVKDSQGQHLHANCGTADGCFCEICKEEKCRSENALYRKEIRDQSWSPLLAMSMLRDEVLCEEKSFACFSGECERCKDNVVGTASCPLETSEEMIWVRSFRYEAVGGGIGGGGGDDDDEEEKEGRKILVLKRQQVTRHQAIQQYLIPTMRKFMLHQHITNEQDRHYKSKKVAVGKVEEGVHGTLKEGGACVTLDFSQNYPHDHPDETQSEWFNKPQSALLPVVVAIGVPDGKGGVKVEQHSRCYVSDHLKHSNKFVQMVMRDCLDYVQEVMEKKGMVFKELDIWSDGCGGQFKNRYQMKWVVDVVSVEAMKERWGLEVVRHNFFSSCHGKGPCDAAGAVVKGLLRAAELGGKYLSTSKDAYNFLKENKEYNDEDVVVGGRKILTRTFVFIDSKDVPLEQQEVKPLANMKSMHSFVANGGQSIRMNPLSCYCVKCEECLFDECERVEMGERKADVVHNTLGYDPNTRLLREGRKHGLLHAYDLLKDSRVGEWVLMYVPKDDRKWAASSTSEEWWDCDGRFRLAQLAHIPDLDEVKRLANQRAGRKRRGDTSELYVYYAAEVEKEKMWSFPCEDECDKIKKTGKGDKTGAAALTMWDNCSTHNKCYRKHAVLAQVEHVWMKIDRGQRVMGEGDDDEQDGGDGEMIRSEAYILQGEEVQKMDGFIKDMSDYFDLS